MEKKCVVLFSGGLDSRLVIKIMQQPLKVVGKVAIVIVTVIALHVLKRVIVLSNSPCKDMDQVAQAEDPICIAYNVSIQSNLSTANIVI